MQDENAHSHEAQGNCQIARSGSTANITVTLVAVDHKGKQIDKLEIDFESMSLGTPEP